jgi:hypothetical protein
LEEEFEIPSAHERAVEHGVERHFPLAQEIALFSAVLATLGAIVSFLGGHTQNDALYYKDEAVLMKARASDSWAYYQAEVLKQHLAQQSAAMMPTSAAVYQADVAKYGARAKTLRAEAEELDRKSQDADQESQRALLPHTKLAISMTFLQIAIALASITALTRKRWLIFGAIASALVGVALGAIAWF